MDEGWCRAWGFGLTTGYADTLAITTEPDGHVNAFQYGVAGVEYFAAVQAHNFALPPGDGRLYIVYAGPDDSDLTEPGISVLGLSNAFFERWLNLRGDQG